MDFLGRHIEALIFCAKDPIREEDLQKYLTEVLDTEVPSAHIVEAITGLEEKYASDEFSFQIYHSGGGYQFLTKPAFQSSINVMLKHKSKKRLSTAALETLAVIAYKQPVTKLQIEQIRGVNCDYTVQRLLEKELVEIKGKAETPGRPLIYGTSERFIDHFGINSVEELPQPKDFAEENNKVGEPKES